MSKKIPKEQAHEKKFVDINNNSNDYEEKDEQSINTKLQIFLGKHMHPRTNIHFVIGVHKKMIIGSLAS
jgi:hypothetical protein